MTMTDSSCEGCGAKVDEEHSGTCPVWLEMINTEHHVHPDTVKLAEVRELMAKWNYDKYGTSLWGWAYKTFWTELHRAVGDGGMTN